MKINNLTLLCCPYCESGLLVNKKNSRQDSRGRWWGIVSCNCDQYPVIANVLYLRKDTGMKNKLAVDHIKERNFYKTILLLVDENRIIKSLLFFLLSSNTEFKKNEVLIYRFLGLFSKHKQWINYLKNRNAKSKDVKKWNPLLKNIKRKDVVVDAGSGNSFIYQNLQEGTNYIGIDFDLLSLLLFQIFNKKIGNLVFICSDLNHGLPVKKATANHVIFLDSLIYMYNTKSILKKSYDALSNGWIYLFGLFSSNQLTDQWGYGVERELLQDYISEYCDSSVTIDSNSLKILKRNDKSTYYSILVKKN